MEGHIALTIDDVHILGAPIDQYAIIRLYGGITFRVMTKPSVTARGLVMLDDEDDGAGGDGGGGEVGGDIFRRW